MEKLSSLANITLWTVVAAAVLAVFIVVAAKLRQKKLLAVAKEYIRENAEMMHAVQAELLETVKFHSENQRQAVNISRFWVRSGVSRPVRTALIRELVDARIVAVVPRTYENGFLEFMGTSWAEFFCIPPSTLILSDRDWLLMVQSRMNGHQILVERMVMTIGGHNTHNTVDTHGGSATGIVQGGSDSIFTFRGNSFQAESVDEAHLRRLILALQHDSELTSDASLAKRIRAHAELLEQDLEEPGTGESRKHLLDRVVSLVGKYSDAMTATAKVLNVFMPGGS